MSDPPTPDPLRPLHWAALLVAALLHSVFVIATWSEAYIDFGDGNYMYIARRVSEGIVLYRDILAPQPPMHLLTGVGIIKLAGAVGMESPLYLFRTFSLALHLATFALIIGIARRAWGSASAGVAAGIIFLYLPIGLWWSMGYQSEPLEVFFLMIMLRFAINGTRPSDIGAGIFAALAAMTNATAAPFLLVLIVFMLIRNWRRALLMGTTALLLAGAMTGIMEWWSEGHFLQNAVFNQVGTYPRGQFFRYALRKLMTEGGDVLSLEGFFIFLGLLGLLRFVRESPLDGEARDGIAWFSLATLGSIFYVSKGGTMDYIFSLAEPALAILGGGEVVRRWNDFRSAERTPLADRLLYMATLACLAFFALGLGTAHYVRLWNGLAFELPDLAPHQIGAANGDPSNVAQVKDWVDKWSEPGDTILAPPFYAVLTDRNLWGEYSEIFIWTIKYWNNVQDENPDGEGWTKVREMAKAIESREMPLIIIEMDQTGRIPEIKQALETNYQMVIPEPYRTLNTRLGVYIPREE